MSTTIEIRPIMNDDDLDQSLAAIKVLSDRELDDREQAELDALVTLSDEYERERFLK